MAQTHQDGTESLASLGGRTISLLGQTVITLTHLAPTSKFATQAPIELVAEEVTRFKLWSGNIGLLQNGHASLDYRLRDSPAVERFVRTLLGDLHETLSNMQEVLSGQRLPFEEMEVTKSDDEMSDTGSDQDVNSQASGDAMGTELGSRVKEVRSVLDRLFRLTTKIRNPASRVGSSKAILFKDVDSETGIDLMEAHAIHDRLHLEEVLRSLRNGIGLDVERYGTFLVERLSEANKRRRQQFKYWKKHREKLARHEVQEQVAAPLARPLPAAVDAWTVAERSQPGTHTHVSLPTTATALLPGYIDLDDTKSIGSTYSAATSVFSNETGVVEAERLMLPPPPVHLLRGKHFECPYCFTLCPKRYLQGKHWREHLWRDLRPYVCTYETCQEAPQLYDSRSDWIKHENWAHRRIWRCSHHAAEFTSQNDYKSHMHSKHNLPLGKALEDMATSATAAANPSHRNCPFCLVPLSKVRGSPEQHMSHHLERAASFALPHSTLVDEASDDEVDAAASGKANTAIGTFSADISEPSVESAALVSLPGNDRPVTYQSDELEQTAPPDIEEPEKSKVNSTQQPFVKERSQSPMAWAMTGNTSDSRTKSPVSSSSNPQLKQMYSACHDGDVTVVSLLLQEGLVLGQDAWLLLKAATSGHHASVSMVLWDHMWRLHPAYIETQLNRFSASNEKQMIDFLMTVLCEAGAAESVRFILDYISPAYQAEPANMMLAINNNHTEVIKVLLLHRRFERLNGIPNALFNACERGFYEAANALLEARANPNGDVNDCIPLYVAAEIGSLPVVELLLSYEATIDRPGQTGDTPLYIAAEMGHIDVVSLLLDLGADPNMSSPNGYTPLHVASSKGLLQVISHLTEHGANLNLQDAAGRTALFEAISARQVDTTVALLDCGADPNLVASSGLTSLQLASRYDMVDTVQSLLSHGAEIEHRGGLNLTPLYQAAISGHFRTGECLIVHGADVNAFCAGGEYLTPLLAACASDTPDLVLSLLKGGANPLFRADHVGSVLSLACSTDKAEIVYIILEHTASLRRNDPFLTSAYLQICVHKRFDLIRLMSDHGVKPDSSALPVAVDSGATDLSKALIEAGADVDAQYQEFTPLGRATAARNLKMVKTLVSLGANVDSPSWYLPKQGQAQSAALLATPLDIAHDIGASDIVIYLLESGAEREGIYSGRSSPVAKGADDSGSVPLSLNSDGGFGTGRPAIDGQTSRRPFLCDQSDCTNLDGFSDAQELWKHRVVKHDIHNGTYYACAIPNCPDPTWTDLDDFKEHIERTHITTHVNDDIDDLVRRSTVHVDIPPEAERDTLMEGGSASTLQANQSLSDYDVHKISPILSRQSARSFADVRSYTPSPIQSLSGNEENNSHDEDNAIGKLDTSHTAVASWSVSTQRSLPGRKLYILDVDPNVNETEFALYFQQFGPVDEVILSPGEPPENSIGLVILPDVFAASAILQKQLQIKGQTIVALPGLYDPMKSGDYGQELSDLRAVIERKRRTNRMPAKQRLLNHLAAVGVRTENVSAGRLAELESVAEYLETIRTDLNKAYETRDLSAATDGIEGMDLAWYVYQSALKEAKSEHDAAVVAERTKSKARAGPRVTSRASSVVDKISEANGNDPSEQAMSQEIPNETWSRTMNATKEQTYRLTHEAKPREAEGSAGRAQFEQEVLTGGRSRTGLGRNVALNRLPMAQHQALRKPLASRGSDSDLVGAKLHADGQKITKGTSGRPVFPKIHHEHLALETLKYYDLPWEYDGQNRDYIIILHELSEEKTNILFAHTRRLRERTTLTFELRQGDKPEFARVRNRSKSHGRHRWQDSD